MSKRFLDGNREVIQRYVEAGGEGVELNDVQMKLLERWRHADEMIRQSFFGKYQLREDIANALKTKFEISRDTAYRDIVNAEHVFSSSAPLNKKYFIQRRIEYITYIISELNKAIEIKDEEGKVVKSYIDERKQPLQQSGKACCKNMLRSIRIMCPCAHQKQSFTTFSRIYLPPTLLLKKPQQKQMLLLTS
jgi:hypothetical protein